MSRALDLFLSVGTSILNRDGGNEPAHRILCDAAAEWRRNGNFLSAAYAMEVAIGAGWNSAAGLADQSIRACVEDCAHCIDDGPLDSIESLAALHLWRGQLRYYEAAARRAIAEGLQRELLERLMVVFSDRPEAVGYLIRGIELVGHLDGGWTVVVPKNVQRLGRSGRERDGRTYLTLPSAFTMLRGFRDYAAMQALITRFEDEFSSTAIKGWKFAVAGELDPAHRGDLFARAADAFEEDQAPSFDAMDSVEDWSGENLYLWSRYYRARSALAGVNDAGADVPHLIEDAATALEGTESGIVIDEVYRFGIVVRSIAALIGAHVPTAVEDALKDLKTAAWLFGADPTDDASQAFLDEAAAMMREFERDPASAMTSGRLVRTLELLAKLPSIGPELAQAVQPAAGQHALSIVRGIDRTWVHRVLAGIRDERQLQKIFYFVAQSGLPHYAQIRQGPQEYGKDIVVLGDESSRNVLRMYHVRCGDIDLPKWRLVKQQLEEMFTVPLATLNINEHIDERIGVLVCNGHALPNADPPMVGWFAQELHDRGHRYEFMHLDALANWIVERRLYGAFRLGLRATGGYSTGLMDATPDSTKPARIVAIQTSCLYTPTGRRVVATGVGGGGGGGGAGYGPLAEPGTSGESSTPNLIDRLIPGTEYVWLIAAGGLGGSSAGRIEDHGQGGVDGGYSAITDGREVFVLGKAQPVPPRASPPVDVSDTPTVTVTAVTEESRYAIVDVATGVVDNIVMAQEGFFDLLRVQEAVLAHRIVAVGDGHVLARRDLPGVAVRLSSDERVAPGWVVAKGVDVRLPGLHRFEPGGRSLSLGERGGRGGRGGVSREPLASVEKPSLCILSIATEWFSRRGGITTLNRDLCIALAAEGHRVVCLIPSPNPGEREHARRHQVVLIDAQQTTGKATSPETGLYRPPRFPDGFYPDVVIGHGHVTGPAAKSQAEDTFRDARRVHVHHTQPGEIEWHKTSRGETATRAAEYEADALGLATTAAVAVGVGPRLWADLARLMHPHTRPHDFELVPGLGGDDDVRVPPPGMECLILGRTEDRELKGLDVAARSVRRTRLSGLAATLTIRGARREEDVELNRDMSTLVGAPNAVRVYPFSDNHDEIKNDMLRAAVVLMPSRSEGFGLVAWEAIGLGVPVLISDQSGVAELLLREAPAIAREVVVAMAVEDEQTIDAWSSRIQNVLRDVPAAFRRAAALRELLRAKFTWGGAARMLVEKIRVT